MKIHLKVFGFISAFVMITGCASTPSEVKDEMSKYNGRDKTISDFDYSYVNVSELKSSSEGAVKRDYGQFTVSDKVAFSQIEELNIMEFFPAEGFLKNSQEAMKLFFSDFIIKKQAMLSDEGITYFFNENDKMYFAAGDHGFIAMLDPETFDISFSYGEPNIMIYHTDRKDDLNDEYLLKNGRCSVKEAVSYVDKWLSEKYRPFSDEFDYKVNTVIVREHEDGYLFQFLAEAFYHGVPLDSYTRKGEFVNGMQTDKMAYVDWGIQIQMVNIDSIDSFTNLIGIIKPKVKEKIEEVISLESVLKLCEKTFSEFKDVEISDIRTMYTLKPVYETDENGCSIVVGYTSRPVWAIIMDARPEEFLAEGAVNTYGDMRKYIYVDMVTGELDYDFDIVMQGIGG